MRGGPERLPGVSGIDAFLNILDSSGEDETECFRQKELQA